MAAPADVTFPGGESVASMRDRVVGATREIAARHGVEAPRVGVTIKEGIAIRNRGSELVQARIESLRNIFETALENKLRG